MIAAAVALGLAYGAIKADNPWSGDGLFQNLQLMSVVRSCACGLRGRERSGGKGDREAPVAALHRASDRPPSADGL